MAKQKAVMNELVLAATELRLGNKRAYSSQAAELKSNNNYSSLIKVLDWKSSSSTKISPELEKDSPIRFFWEFPCQKCNSLGKRKKRNGSIGLSGNSSKKVEN